MTDAQVYHLEVDHREWGSDLAELALCSERFDVVFGHLKVGDYIVQHSILIERKTQADLAVSLIDGRLFRQAAAMARSPLRTLLLVEGPCPERVPDLHPHSVLGAMLSLSVVWRLPVVFSRDPRESLLILRFLAEQARTSQTLELRRCGYRPRRPTRKKLYLLQGLPGVGPKLAADLLSHFGTVEKVMSAGEELLKQVRGCGPKKARGIREVLQ